MVCTETFHALFGGRGCEENQGKVAGDRPGDRAGAEKNVIDQSTGPVKNDAEVVTRTATTATTCTAIGTTTKRTKGGGGIDKFVVPRPTPYVPDWAAFGCEESDNEAIRNGTPSASTSDLEEKVRLEVATSMLLLPYKTHAWMSVSPAVFKPQKLRLPQSAPPVRPSWPVRHVAIAVNRRKKNGRARKHSSIAPIGDNDQSTASDIPVTTQSSPDSNTGCQC